MQAITLASNRARDAINAGVLGHNWQFIFNLKEQYGTYNQMLWSFHKWTFKQFYPDFEDRIDLQVIIWILQRN